MMPLFRKEPIVIEAFRLGQKGQPTPAPYWFVDPVVVDEGILIKTLEGTMLARWGDWIIKGVSEEIYPCKDEIFTKTYKLVTNE